MRVMVTPQIQTFYPDGQAAAARATTAQLQSCYAQLLTHLPPIPRERLQLIIHRGELNNAYVHPPAGAQPTFMVLPMHQGLEMFNLLNFGVAGGTWVGCHEAVHYVMLNYITGFWRGVNAAFGDVISPQNFLDPWVHEGMATYYEAKLAGPVGRPTSALWRGMFEAAAAGENYKLHAGHLAGDRRIEFGGRYLIGMHFIEYLAQTYGEKKLWDLVERQGDAVLAPFAITLRFAAVFGKTIDVLFEDFLRSVRAGPKRTKPATQTTLHEVDGTWARLASCPNEGLYAVLHNGPDMPPTLTVHDDTGNALWHHNLTQVWPQRDIIRPSGQALSGLSFTQNCQRLYFVVADLDRNTASQTNLVEVNMATHGLHVSKLGQYGVGGGIDALGERYVYVALQDASAQLRLRFVETGEELILPNPQGVLSLGAPAFSPAGQTVAFAGQTADGFQLFALDLPTQRSRQLTAMPGFHYAPHFVDAEHLLFVRPDASKHLQAYSLNLQDLSTTQQTDAPYAVMDAVPGAAGHVTLLNAKGWGWSLDQASCREAQSVAALPPPQALQTASAQPTAPARSTSTTWPAISAPSSPPAQTPPGEDQPYHPAQHLGFPSLRLPVVNYLSGGPEPPSRRYLIGGYVLGQDRLGLHGYSALATYAPIFMVPSASLAYLNRTQMPWTLSAVASFSPTELTLGWRAALAASRPFYTTTLSLSLQALYTAASPWLDTGTRQTQVVGPGVSLRYGAQEATAYAGARRGLGLAIAVQGYPRQVFGNTAGFVDTSLLISAVTPLPVSRRHRLAATLRGRTLWGTGEAGLRIGSSPQGSGNSVEAAPARGASRTTLDRYATALDLSETQRGFEDWSWYARSSVLGEVTYHYPMIVDYGWHSFLYFFPSLFIPQVDFELFASGSYSVRRNAQIWHRAAGGYLGLQTQWGQLASISFGYQLAHRFDIATPAVEHLFMLNL